MALLSSLRSRRLITNPQIEIKQKVIAFQIAQYWFAVPVTMARKVIPWEIADLQSADPPIRLLDAGQCLLGKPLLFQPQALLILHSQSDQGVGLPIASQPILHRVAASQLQPIPPTYDAQAQRRGIYQWIPACHHHPALLIVDPGQLG
jgi:chemotaxis signal transduction protein